jgi:hypothetical protein
VPAGQARALARYMALITSGAVEAAALMPPPPELQAPSELVVDPLTVAPMNVGGTNTGPFTNDHGTQKE